MGRIPNLFIVGAARSGTTSLWARLRSHPSVFMPGVLRHKEPAFFSPLKKSMYKRRESYLGLFAGANEGYAWIGEASTAYLTDPESAGLIRTFNPEARILIMLRNPARRAYSLFNWMVQEGFEYAASFPEALALERERSGRPIPNSLEPEYYYNYLYFSSGLYEVQVRRYLELFKERVLVLRFEDYVGAPDKVWERVCRFLSIDSDAGVDPGPRPANESRRVPSSLIPYILRKLGKFYHSHPDALARDGFAVGAGPSLKTLFFDRAERELEVLERVRPITRTERRRLFVALERAAEQRDREDPGQDPAAPFEREVWVKWGRVEEPPAALDRRLYRGLIEDYRRDIEALSESARTDFSAWLR